LRVAAEVLRQTHAPQVKEVIKQFPQFETQVVEKAIAVSPIIHEEKVLEVPTVQVAEIITQVPSEKGAGVVQLKSRNLEYGARGIIREEAVVREDETQWHGEMTVQGKLGTRFLGEEVQVQQVGNRVEEVWESGARPAQNGRLH